MRGRGVLGTAGHIDHGKTALVAALTGVDTDRLKEEKARGITIELGFAELPGVQGPDLGVVDVPGHEGFVRTMVAGATGMDVVLLVVSAEEGVMPQTREHLDIVRLLDVPELVVALTKRDLVEDDWLGLVTDEIRELLAGTPYDTAAVVPVSAVSGDGLDVLRQAIDEAAGRAVRDRSEDVTRLPLDRVFTVRGTGTVATGTLWSGALREGMQVQVLPGDGSARIRGLQVHGRPVSEARGGDRTAVALAGPGLERAGVARGAWIVADAPWRATWMLTARVSVLPGALWPLTHNQRVRVHLGTAEVLARVVALETDEIVQGGSGWVQLRLEAPTVARCRDRLILRSYSPVTTLGGGIVAEPWPSKRRRLTREAAERLGRLAEGDAAASLSALLEDAGWAGVPVAELPLRTGFPPGVCTRALAGGGEGVFAPGDVAFSATVAREGADRIVAFLEAEHRTDPLTPSVSRSRVRAVLPSWAHPKLADWIIASLLDEGQVEEVDGGLRRAGFTPTPSADQEDAARRMEAAFARAGLAFPAVSDLPSDLAGREDLWPLLRLLEARGVLVSIADGVYVHAPALAEAIERLRAALGGRSDLGPTDFREVLQVSRKHLIPILNHLDGLGVTRREGDLRRVP